MDQKAIEDCGFDKGVKQGKKEKTIAIAKKMKQKNVDIDFISEITELTKEEINNL